MFTTYRHSEMALDGEADCSASQLWRSVEQELMLPWFYLQIARRIKRQAHTSMLMIYHAHEVLEILESQSNRAWVEQIQFVTPPHMNGQSRWLMEPLRQISIVTTPPQGNPILLLKVASGPVYASSHELITDEPPSRILFSADTDLHPR